MTALTIQSIPDEILIEIMWIIYLSVDQQSRMSWRGLPDNWGFLCLMHICHKWRELVINEGKLWSFIDITNERMALLSLERSQGAGLTITDDSLSKEPISQAVEDAIYSVSDRIESLTLCRRARIGSTTPLMTTQLIGFLTSNVLKSLVDLRLNIPGSLGPSGNPHHVTFAPFSTMPCLKRLSILRTPFLAPAGCFSNLRSLGLRLNRESFSLDTFLNAFGPRNHLESLDVWVARRAGGHIPRHGPIQVSSTPIEFPSLQYLMMVGSLATDVHTFLTRTIIPNSLRAIAIIAASNSSPLSDFIPEPSMRKFSLPPEDSSVEVNLSTSDVEVRAENHSLSRNSWRKRIGWTSLSGQVHGTLVLDWDQLFGYIIRVMGSPHVKALTIRSHIPDDGVTPLQCIPLLSAYPNVCTLRIYDALPFVQALGTLTRSPDDGLMGVPCPGIVHLLVDMRIPRPPSFGSLRFGVDLVKILREYEALLKVIVPAIEARVAVTPLHRLTIVHPDFQADFPAKYIDRLAESGGIEELNLQTRPGGFTSETRFQESSSKGMRVIRYDDMIGRW